MIEAGGPMAEEESQAIVERYIMLARRYNLTHVNERDRFDPAQVQVEKAALKVSADVYETFPGRYEMVDAPTDLVQGLGAIITLSVEEKRFLVETNQGKMQFHPQTERLFTAALDSNIVLRLIQDAQEQTTGLVITLLDGRQVDCRKVE